MTQSYCGTSETKLILTFPQNIEQGPQVALIVTFTSFDSKFYTHRSVVVARRRLVTRGKLPGSSAIILDLMILSNTTLYVGRGCKRITPTSNFQIGTNSPAVQIQISYIYIWVYYHQFIVITLSFSYCSIFQNQNKRRMKKNISPKYLSFTF